MRSHTSSIARKEKPWAGLFPFLFSPSTKKDIHLLRKLWHAGMTLLIVLLYAYTITDRNQALGILLSIAIPFIILDISRLWFKPLNKFIIFVFGPLMRKRELMTMSSTSPFLLAAIIVIAFFPKPIAILSLLCLGFGDVAACVVGIKFGKDELIPGKSLQGSLACFGVCALLTFGFLHIYQISSEYIAFISVMGGLIPTLAELLASKKIDDNFIIPIITASTIYPLLLLLSSF